MLLTDRTKITINGYLALNVNVKVIVILPDTLSLLTSVTLQNRDESSLIITFRLGVDQSVIILPDGDISLGT